MINCFWIKRPIATPKAVDGGMKLRTPYRGEVLLFFHGLSMSHTSLAVHWIAYISQDETTEVP